MNQYWVMRNLEYQSQWDFQETPELTSADDWGAFQEEMLKGFIKIKEGLDILRWGYTDRGSFSIKESYNIRLGNHVEDDRIWKMIWVSNL